MPWGRFLNIGHITLATAHCQNSLLKICFILVVVECINVLCVQANLWDFSALAPATNLAETSFQGQLVLFISSKVR